MFSKTFRISLVIFLGCFFDFVKVETEILHMINEIYNSSFSDNTSAENYRVSNDTKEILNITCIMDKYGVGYVGTKNVTYDGTPCIDWSRNYLLYTRYKMRGKNISDNYCRNPDRDSSGPWCFVANKSIFKRQFKFKHCGIPLCSSKAAVETSEITMGVPLTINRDCPAGFKKRTIENFINNITFCEVKQEYLDKLPSGQYSFQLLNDNNTCPEGFKSENSFYNISFYCTKTDSNESIDFPKYLTPKAGEMIFMLMKFGYNATCPVMSTMTSVIIHKMMSSTISRRYFTLCHYFYKLSSNKDYVDRKLAILVFRKDCPNNWKAVLMSFKWKFMLTFEGSYKQPPVYACIPNHEIKDYPDGDYCLLSLLSTKLGNRQCPEEFIDVDMKVNGKLNTKFCCRQSTQKADTNALYNFFQFQSVLIVNSVNSCPKTSSKKNISVKQYTFDSLLYKENFECPNCELFSVFNIRQHSLGRRFNYFKIQFRVCSYEKALNGFAYATLNSRCPTDMKYAYIKYAKDRFSNFLSPKITASFCTIVDYPNTIQFPEGRYCIYKLGGECPQGFQSVTSKDSLVYYRYSDSGGDISNYQMDVYCCKNGPKNVTFENAVLPYVTSNFEFGLPYANESFSCIHGLDTHTAVEDSHMCHYYPVSDSSARVSIVFPSMLCEHRAYKYFGAYRFIYNSRLLIRYCYFFVNDSPPPGNYCAPFAKTCPSQYFYYVTYHPLIQRVICCRKPTPNAAKEKESKFSPSRWVNELRSFSLLAYKNKCPIFERYNYGKEPIKRYYNYKAGKLPLDHKRNLTEIGVDIVNTGIGTSVTMYSCDYKLDPYNKSVVWPHGQYAFPRPLGGCPTSFKSGNITHFMETANPSFAHSDTIHLDGEYMIGGTNIKWGFCVKKDNYVKDKLFLPYGRYCLMKVDYTCPTGFSDGSVKFVETTVVNKLLIQKKGVLPKIDITGPFITYYFCCQSGRGDVAHQPMYLPTESGSFYLLKFGSYCQMVYGMKFTEEFICIDSEDSPQHLNYTFQAPYKVEGFTPVTGSFIRGCDFQINLCYYEKDIPLQNRTTEKPKSLVNWPKGSYVVIKKLRDVCPEGFSEGNVTVLTLFNSFPKFMHTLMFGPSNDNSVIFSFCKRNALNDSKPAEEWPEGNYCFIFEKKCPTGMMRFKSRFLEKFTARIQNGALMTDWSNLCCMMKKSNTSNILPYFPGSYYSTILKLSPENHSCPPHNNTRVALIDWEFEIICYYERKEESIDFPDGDYLIPAPTKSVNNCITGFKLVKHHHSHLNGKDVTSKLLTFCAKEITNSTQKRFPRGNYCILTTQENCPSNQFTIQNMLTIPMYRFSQNPNKLSRYLACCQNDDRAISNLVTQNIPFRMYASSTCSYVDGMPSVHMIDEETDLIQQSLVERPPYIRDEKKFRICKYDNSSIWDLEAICQCHRNAYCRLSYNDKICHCKPGYFGNGKTICSKITNKTDQCGDVCSKPFATCEQSSSESYSCVCKEGYEGDGIKCIASCKTKNCNVFSRCVVDSKVSYCECKSEAIVSSSGTCHGDLINTIYHLPGYANLIQMNISCFSNEVYNHLVIPDKGRTLYLIIPLDKNIFSKCEDIDSHFGFSDARKIYPDIIFKTEITSQNKNTISILKTELNQWIIYGKISVSEVDLFTNAVVLYLNNSNEFMFEKYNIINSKVQMNMSKPLVTGIVLTALLVVIVAIVLAAVIYKRRSNSIFNRLYETRSESNIHFITADEKLEMES